MLAAGVRLLACALVLAPSTGRASPSQPAPLPLIALHPLDGIELDERESTRLGTALRTHVQATGATLVPEPALAQALARIPEGSCARATDPQGCLAALARATGATHALLVTLAPHAPGPAVRGAASLVSPRGGTVRALDEFTYPRRPAQASDRLGQAERALASLVAQLELHALPSPVADASATTVVASGASGGPSLRRLGGYALLGAGAAAGVSGLFVMRAAGQDADAIERNLDDGLLVDGDLASPELQRRFERRRTLGTVLYVGSAAALASGAALLWLSPSRPRAPTSPALGVVPIPGGASVLLQGSPGF